MKRHNRILAGILAMLLLLTAAPFTAIAASTADSAVFKTEDWIWSTDKVTINSVSYFRKEYTLASKPTALTIRASAQNHMKYYVNGELISGLVTPAPSAPPESMLYLTYSFSGAELNKLFTGSGTQLCLAAAVQYIGNDGCNYTNGVPAFWTEATVAFADGTEQKLVSGMDWSALTETPYKNETPAMSSRRMNAQVDYDARKMPDALAWTRFGYDESSYTAGTWQKAVKAGEETASWKLRPQMIPEGVVHDRITPTPVARQEAGWQVFDTGRTVSGWVRVRLKAPAGTRIHIRYSEYLDGDIVHYGVGSKKQTSENYCDYYTFAGTGVEEFAPDFDYKAFRYFEVVGMPEMIKPEDISVEWASTGIEQTATFTSSDEFLTKLYQACINTQFNNIQGMPVDCPHREQSQYLADSQLQYPLLTGAFTASTELMEKMLRDFAATQLENGRYLYTAPTESYKKYASIPEWDLRYTDTLARYIELTGDPKGAEEFYDSACRNVKFHMSLMEGGLLPDEPGARNISDHPEKPIADDPGDGLPLTIANLLLYDSMNKLGKIATQLGKAGDASAWKGRAATLKERINATLLDKETYAYKKHSGTDETNPGATAMAINVGVALPEHRAAQLEQLTKTTTDDTSVVLTYEVFRALATYGTPAQKDAIYTRMKESWAKMLEGHQTVWEGLTTAHQSSRSHAWSAYPAAFMLSSFLGINRGEDGAACVTPFLPTAVDEIRGEARIPGTDKTVSVSLRRQYGYLLNVTASAPVTVAVPRPGEKDTMVTVGGTTVFRDGTGSDTDGVKYLENDAEYVYFAVEQGVSAEFHATETWKRLLGDVNEDAIVNAKDVTLLRRYLAGGYGVTINERVGDTNKDETVNAKDVTILRRYVVGGYGIELGTVDGEAIQRSYTDAVTGGQVYEDLGKPTFGRGTEKYSLTVLVDGKEDRIYTESFREKIVSGNTEEITPVGSYTEVTSDPDTMRVTVNTMRYYIAQIDGVYPAEGDKEAYITLKKVDWNALPAEQPFDVKESGKTWNFTQTYTTDDFTAADVGAYVVYTKNGEAISSLTRAETRTGAVGMFTGTEDGILTEYKLDGTSYKVATREPAFDVDRAAAATVYPDLSETNPTICLDPNGNLLHVVLPQYNEENSSAMFLAAARADKKKGDERTMPIELKDGMKLLIIGNSFGNDSSLTYLPNMFKAAGVKDYVVGTLYYSGCPYSKHVNFGMQDQAVYDYYENTELTKPEYIDKNGNVAKPEKVTFDYALGHQEWTHIMTLTSYAQFDKDLGSNPPWQDLLLCRVRNRCPDAYLGYDMTWAYKADYTGSEMFNTKFNNDQMALYRYITEAVHAKILPEERFKFVAPVGTAIQNARTSFIGDHMDRDGHHLNKGIGRYTAQMTVFCLLTGVSPDELDYLPAAYLTRNNSEYTIEGVDRTQPGLLDMLGKVARESVKNALANPYEVTQSQYAEGSFLWAGENEMPIN